MIGITTTGADKVSARFANAGGNVRDALRKVIQQSVIDMETRVKEKLSGPVLKNRTGRLRNSVTSKVEDSDTTITGIVGANTPYAAAHEYGFKGTVVVREHMRTITSAFGRPLKARTTFKVQSHDMDMDLAQRSYLRSTLAEQAPGIVRLMRIAVIEASEA